MIMQNNTPVCVELEKYELIAYVCQVCSSYASSLSGKAVFFEFLKHDKENTDRERASIRVTMFDSLN